MQLGGDRVRRSWCWRRVSVGAPVVATAGTAGGGGGPASASAHSPSLMTSSAVAIRSISFKSISNSTWLSVDTSDIHEIQSVIEHSPPPISITGVIFW